MSSTSTAHQRRGSAMQHNISACVVLTVYRLSQGGPAPDVLLRLWDMLKGLTEAAQAAAQAEQWDALNAWALLPAVFGETASIMIMVLLTLGLLHIRAALFNGGTRFLSTIHDCVGSCII